MGKTLMTRATGFIGASLVRNFLENGLTVRAESDDRNLENFERVAVDACDAAAAEDTVPSHATLARARSSTPIPSNRFSILHEQHRCMRAARRIDVLFLVLSHPDRARSDPITAPVRAGETVAPNSLAECGSCTSAYSTAPLLFTGASIEPLHT